MVARDEKVWIRPISRLFSFLTIYEINILNMVNSRTVARNPQGTRVMRVMGTWKRGDKSLKTGRIDSLNDRTRESGMGGVMVRSGGSNEEVRKIAQRKRSMEISLSARTGHH